MAMPAPDFSLCLFLIPERVVCISNFFFFLFPISVFIFSHHPVWFSIPSGDYEWNSTSEDYKY